QWGLRTRYVGKLGEDHAAVLHRAEFQRLGVEAHLITAPASPSLQSFILVDQAGERTVLWKRDARLTLLPQELAREWIVNARVLHLDGHYSGHEALLPNIGFLITSRDIPARLTGEPDLRLSLPQVHRRYACRLT